MRLRFQLANLYVVYEIDRKEKKLKVASRNTSMQLVELPWKMLFDKDKEDFQDEMTKNLNDDDFILALTAAMAQVGYKVIFVEK